VLRSQSGRVPLLHILKEVSVMKVRDAMTTEVKMVRPEASLKDVASILAEHRISGLPVVDDGGNLLGVISEGDIVLKQTAEVPHGLQRLLHHKEASAVASKVEARTAGEAMSAPAITAAPSWLLGEAAALMIEHGVKRLPVVEEGKLVGILTRFDLVRAFARSDAEIEREIREEALRGLSFPEQLQVTVRNGEVALRGKVESKFEAEALPASVRRIPGVVSVDSELAGWDPDSNEEKVVSARL
jgi:CBS domain-containing protein